MPEFRFNLGDAFPWSVLPIMLVSAVSGSYCRGMKHRWPILVILLTIGCVFARLIFATDDGTPFRLIPFDFRMCCAPWLIYGWDMIRAGCWPLWCPYAGAGTPFFLNPQTQTYSPFALLLGPLFGYSYRLAQLHEVAMIALAGVGAYGLSNAIWKSRSAALLSGLCYGLSSPLFSHLEHFPILSAYAWAPCIFWAILSAIEKRSRWGYIAIAAVTYSLMTAGYLGVLLMLIPWSSAFALALIFRATSDNRERLRLIAQSAFAGGLGTAMAAINWLPFLASRSEYTRGDALGFDTVFGAVGSLTPKHLWGLLYSFMTSIPFPGTESDISMRGLYFGAVALVLAVVCLVWVRQWIVGPLATLAIGSLLMALGGAFFLRIAIHMALPFFNMSRFPAADSRYLGVLALCVLAGGGALAATAERAQASDFAQRAFKFLLVFYAISLVGLQWILGKPIDVVISAVTFDAVCMLLALLVVHRYQGTTAVLLLCGIAVLETGYCITANFDLAGQAISGPNYLALSHHERGFPKDGILSPRLGQDPHLNEDTSSAYVGKKFFLTDYNPLRLRRLFALLDRGFGQWLKEGPRVVALPAGSSPDNFATFSSLAKPVKFSITGFGPNQMDYEVDLDSDALLVFNEMYFPGWKATIDSQAARVKPLAEGLRSLSVSAGHHKLVFKFRPILFFVALGISLTGILVFFAWFVRVWRRRAVTAAA